MIVLLTRQIKPKIMGEKNKQKTINGTTGVKTKNNYGLKMEARQVEDEIIKG